MPEIKPKIVSVERDCSRIGYIISLSNGDGFMIYNDEISGRIFDGTSFDKAIEDAVGERYAIRI